MTEHRLEEDSYRLLLIRLLVQGRELNNPFSRPQNQPPLTAPDPTRHADIWIDLD